MPQQLSSVDDYRQQRDALIELIMDLLRRIWAQLDASAPVASYNHRSGTFAAQMIAGQLAMTRLASHESDAVLAELGIKAPPVGDLVPSSFIGFASDGRDMSSLLELPARTVAYEVARGAAQDAAMDSGLAQMESIISTELVDTHRSAMQVEIASRPAVTHWVRMLTLPSCARCVILAGRVYKWKADFLRHPNCFPAGVVVSGPAAEAATRRWYEGELIVLRTASGQELSATANHPVLTDRGWVPANFLQEGDHVVRSLLPDGARPVLVPDEHQVPARIEDLWSARGMRPLGRMPVTSEDFHGDGGHGEVDVVLPDRLVRNRVQATSLELLEEELLPARMDATGILDTEGMAESLLRSALHTSGGLVGLLGLLSSLLGSQLPGAYAPRLTPAADRYASRFEARTDGRSGNAVALLERQLTGSGAVLLDDLLPRQITTGPRWDAPAGPLTEESRAGYAGRGSDLRRRLASQVSLDRIVELRRVQWSGHVYNLSSVEGWYSANGLIVSNCDCTAIPATEDAAGDLRTDPEAALRAGQVRGLSRADAQAVLEHGADLNKVVNVRRLSPLGWQYGSTINKRVTPQGTVKKTPALILHEAGGDRERAIDQLNRYGYIVDRHRHS